MNLKFNILFVASIALFFVASVEAQEKNPCYKTCKKPLRDQKKIDIKDCKENSTNAIGLKSCLLNAIGQYKIGKSQCLVGTCAPTPAPTQVGFPTPAPTQVGFSSPAPTPL